MKTKIYELLYLSSILLFYYLSKPNNTFIIIVLGILYIIFSNIINTISLNKDKSLFKDSILTIIFLNIIFLIITMAIAFMLTKIFYLNNTILILLILSFTYPIKSLINISCEYLKLNHYKKLGTLIQNFSKYLNILIFILNTYLSLKILNLNSNISLIFIITIQLIINYLLIGLIFYFINKKIPHSKSPITNTPKISLIIKNNLTSVIIENYNHILTYISVVYLFYLLTSRYYYSYKSTSTLIIETYLYFNTLIYLIIYFITLKKTKNIIPLTLSVSIIGISLINVLTPAIIPTNDSYILTLLLIELFFIIICYKTLSTITSKKRLNLSLTISIFSKIILTLPLIESFYLSGYSPIIGDIISSIISYLVIITINNCDKLNIPQKSPTKLLNS